MGSFSLWHWLIVLAIVVLVFGTKRLGNVGKDLGEAVKGFKKGMRDEEDDRPAGQLRDDSSRDDTTRQSSENKQDDRTPR